MVSRKNLLSSLTVERFCCLCVDMNSTLSEVLLKSCVSPALLSDRLALEHVMLVAILHHRLGQEVGEEILTHLCR